MTDDREKELTGDSISGYGFDDLTDAIAVMARIPRRYLDPLYGVRPENQPDFDRYLREWQSDVVELLGPHFDGFPSGPPKPSYYLIPPAAGPDTDFIFAILQNADHLIQQMDAYIGLGSALISLARRRKERETADDDSNFHGNSPTFLYGSLPALRAMCLSHAHERYYDPATHPRIELQSMTRNVHTGSAQHPTPGVQFTFVVRVGQSDYVYVVGVEGRVKEHFRIQDGKLLGLMLPDWFDERREYDPLIPTDHTTVNLQD